MIDTFIWYIVKPLLRNSVDNFNAVSFIKALAAVYALWVSFFIGSMISQANFTDANSLLFFYIIADIFLKLIGPLPYTIPLQYIYLPVKRRSLAHYLVSFTVFLSPYLLLAILFFTGYFLNASNLTAEFVIKFLLLISLSAAVTLSLKLGFFNAKALALLSVYIAFIVLALQYHYFNVIVVVLIGAALFIIAYAIAYSLVIKRLSVDHFSLLNPTRSSLIEKINFFSDKTSLYSLEWKMVTRSKRPLTYFIISFVYVLMFANIVTETSMNSIFFGFILSAVTCILILQYTQFIFCWESSFINFYFLQTTASNFIASKMQFLYTLMAINFVIVAPLIFISEEPTFLLLAMFSVASLFHTGITIPLIIYMGFHQQNKIDLEKSAVFNYEGTSWAVFAIIFVAVLPLGIIYMALKLVMDTQYVALCLFIISIIGVLNTVKLRQMLASRLRRSAKYELIDNFSKSK